MKNKRNIIIASILGLILLVGGIGVILITNKTSTQETLAPNAPSSVPGAASCTLEFTVAGTPTPTPSPTPSPSPGIGSLQVCKVVIADGVASDSWDTLPDTTFAVEIGAKPKVTTGTDSRTTSYGTTPKSITFSTGGTQPTLDTTIGAPVVCVTYDDQIVLPADGSAIHFTYKPENISPAGDWDTPKYSDGGAGNPTITSSTTYDDVLFDGVLTNDADRNKGADGDVQLSLDKPTRTILIVNAITEPTPTPTPVPQCTSECVTNNDCPSSMTCSGGSCRNPSCTDSDSCVCATSSPTPTPTPAPQCNSSCTSNAQCPSDLICQGGACRRPGCTASDTCACGPTASPSPAPQCNDSCVTNNDCPSSMTCAGGSCRNPSCTQSTNCTCTTTTTSVPPEETPEQPLPVSGVTLPTIGLIGTGTITIIIGILGLLML